MATSVDPQIAVKRRLLRPLPTPGASKRVRAQKQVQPEGAADSNTAPALSEAKDKSDLNEDSLPTPKASSTSLAIRLYIRPDSLWQPESCHSSLRHLRRRCQ